MMDKVLNKRAEAERDDSIGEKLGASTSEDARIECRSCLAVVQEDACVDVFCAWNPPWPGMGLSMAEDLAKLAGIQISVSDPHSKIICKTCCTNLQNAVSFMVSVQNSDNLLRNRLKHSFTEASSWPKPIQIDKNISNDALQDMEMELENIKQEVVSEDEFDNNVACNETADVRLETLDIKIEPEEMTQQNILIEINSSIIQPSEKNITSIPNGDAETQAVSGELFQDVKEEPLTDDETTPDIDKDCMLCTKAFHTVKGLKAHVIAVHSYDYIMTPKPPVNRTNECPICNRCFATRTDLFVHETCHSQFACYVCDKKFDNFQQLSRHRTKHCKKRSVLPRLKTLDDVRRVPPPSESKKFKSSHLRNDRLYDTINDKGQSAPEVSLDIHNIHNQPENITTQHVINLINVNSKIEESINIASKNTDKPYEANIHISGLEFINKAKMEGHPEVLCPLEHSSNRIASEIKHIENNNELEENSSVRQMKTAMPCIEKGNDICPYDENICNDDEVTNDNPGEMEKDIFVRMIKITANIVTNENTCEMEKDICLNDGNNCKDSEVTVDNTSEIEKDIGRKDENNCKGNVVTIDNTSEMETEKHICSKDEINCKDSEMRKDNTSETETEEHICSNDEINCKDSGMTNDDSSEVTSINICSKEGSRFNMFEESNVDKVLSSAKTSETSSNDTIESEINIKENDAQTSKSGCEITIPEQIVTKEINVQNEINVLHSKIQLECNTEESMEIQLGAHSLDKEQNNIETVIEMKRLEQD